MKGFFTLSVKIIRGLTCKESMLNNAGTSLFCPVQIVNNYTHITNNDAKISGALFVFYPIPFLTKSVPVLIKIVL